MNIKYRNKLNYNHKKKLKTLWFRNQMYIIIESLFISFLIFKTMCKQTIIICFEFRQAMFKQLIVKKTWTKVFCIFSTISSARKVSHLKHTISNRQKPTFDSFCDMYYNKIRSKIEVGLKGKQSIFSVFTLIIMV